MKSLVIILVGENGPSVLYVKRKLLKASEKGIEAKLIKMAENSTEQELISRIQALNAENEVGGLMVQLPLPGRLRERTREILDMIDPVKDVDCLTTASLQLLEKGQPRFYPAAVRACLAILGEQLGLKIVGSEGKKLLLGKKAVVIGKSDLVGKPMAMALHNFGAEVVVTTRQADILVSATGVAHLVKREMVKPGAIVIDVGIARDENGKLVGDVDFEEVSKVAAFVSPVPGGVGPRTVECLLDNFLNLSK